jgi:hypothetical protein
MDDEEPTSVYMIYSAGRIKIGHTANLFARKRHLENSSATPCYIVYLDTGGSIEEAELHKRFAADRLHGEWFTLSDDLRAFILENDDETAETSLADAEAA